VVSYDEEFNSFESIGKKGTCPVRDLWGGLKNLVGFGTTKLALTPALSPEERVTSSAIFGCLQI